MNYIKIFGNRQNETRSMIARFDDEKEIDNNYSRLISELIVEK